MDCTIEFSSQKNHNQRNPSCIVFKFKGNFESEREKKKIKIHIH